MKNISDYSFDDSWQLRTLNMQPGDEFLVVMDVGDLKKGDRVRFAGFCDIDNHYGIAVFADANGRALEYAGDYSGPDHYPFRNLALALSKT